jgi:hypothetical protein
MARGPIIIAFELHVYQWPGYVPHYFSRKKKYISGFLQWPDGVHTAAKLQALSIFSYSVGPIYHWLPYNKWTKDIRRC